MTVVQLDFVRHADVVRKDARQQVAWGVVLEPRGPEDPDGQGDWYTADDIAKAAHRFLTRLAASDAGADHMHDGRPIGVVVESYIAPSDLRLGGQVVKAGSWVAGIHYPDPGVWDLVEKGQLGAFSVGGRGTRL